MAMFSAGGAITVVHFELFMTAVVHDTASTGVNELALLPPRSQFFSHSIFFFHRTNVNF